VIVFDSNMIIYAADPRYGSLRRLIEEGECVVSAISKVEVLGYHKIEPEEVVIFNEFFRFMKQIPVTDEVLDKAVALRQQKNTSVCDAVIGATALLFGAELYTRNTKDFTLIPGLRIVNPLDEETS